MKFSRLAHLHFQKHLGCCFCYWTSGPKASCPCCSNERNRLDSANYHGNVKLTTNNLESRLSPCYSPPSRPSHFKIPGGPKMTRAAMGRRAMCDGEKNNK